MPTTRKRAMVVAASIACSAAFASPAPPTGHAGQIDYPLEYPYQSDFGAVVITKLSADGASLVYSTYLSARQADAITVDATGAAYVVGNAGDGFPLENAMQSTLKGETDAFVTKLSPDGTSLV